MTKKLDIEFPQDFYLDDVGGWRLKKEKITELEASNVQTNEEHLRSLNTEQLAEFLLAHMDCLGCPASCEKCHRYYDACKETMLEWLKQPHTAK